jgi:hypothetical protein
MDVDEATHRQMNVSLTLDVHQCTQLDPRRVVVHSVDISLETSV